MPTVILSLLIVGVGIASGSWKIVVACHLILFALVVVDYMLTCRLTNVSCQRIAPTSTRVGESITCSLTFTNSGRRKLHVTARDAWPPSARVAPEISSFTIPPQASYIISETLTPQRRGILRSEHLTLRINGPFHLAGRQRSFPSEWDVSVLPPFHARKLLPSRIARLRELEGRALLLARGAGTEFDSLRAYVPGDDVRSIDWRSTARIGDTVVRTWRPTRDRQVIIVMDSGRGGSIRIGEAPAFDAAIETTLLMAALTSKAGDRTDVLALDGEARLKLLRKRTDRTMHEIAMRLAPLDPRLVSTNWAALPKLVRSMASSPALVIVVTTLSVASVPEGLIDAIYALRERHNVILASPVQESQHAHGNSLREVYMEAAEYRSELELDVLIAALTRAGAHVVSAEPSVLPGRVADAYIDLKALGQL